MNKECGLVYDEIILEPFITTKNTDLRLFRKYILAGLIDFNNSQMSEVVARWNTIIEQEDAKKIIAIQRKVLTMKIKLLKSGKEYENYCLQLRNIDYDNHMKMIEDNMLKYKIFYDLATLENKNNHMINAYIDILRLARDKNYKQVPSDNSGIVYNYPEESCFVEILSDDLNNKLKIENDKSKHMIK
jgi:hypothetical protein